MSLYIALRFKGIVKRELREIFEPIALKGKWHESPDSFLKEFGDYNKPYDSRIPCGACCILKRWEKVPWERKYNKETGEWIFEADINTRTFPWLEWKEEIVPYCMEAIEHFETWYEAWESHDESTALERFENGKFTLLGWFNNDGSFISVDELKKQQK